MSENLTRPLAAVQLDCGARIRSASPVKNVPGLHTTFTFRLFFGHSKTLLDILTYSAVFPFVFVFCVYRHVNAQNFTADSGTLVS